VAGNVASRLCHGCVTVSGTPPLQALPATVRTGLCVGPGRLEGDAAFLADGNARGDWIAVVEDRAGPVIASEPEPGNILRSAAAEPARPARRDDGCAARQVGPGIGDMREIGRQEEPCRRRPSNEVLKQRQEDVPGEWRVRNDRRIKSLDLERVLTARNVAAGDAAQAERFQVANEIIVAGTWFAEGTNAGRLKMGNQRRDGLNRCRVEIPLAYAGRGGAR
jgi:hypothetical protein